MDEGLKRALKESAATSVVHTIGQRVFLHNFDCKGTALLFYTHPTVPLTPPLGGLPRGQKEVAHMTTAAA